MAKKIFVTGSEAASMTGYKMSGGFCRIIAKAGLTRYKSAQVGADYVPRAKVYYRKEDIETFIPHRNRNNIIKPRKASENLKGNGIMGFLKQENSLVAVRKNVAPTKVETLMPIGVDVEKRINFIENRVVENQQILDEFMNEIDSKVDKLFKCLEIRVTAIEERVRNLEMKR